MIYVASILTIVFFMAALWALKVVPVASEAINTSRNATKTLFDPGVDEDSKEEILRKASLSLVKYFISILFRGSASVAVSVLPVVVFDFTGLATFENVVDFLLSWEVAIIASLVMILSYSFFKFATTNLAHNYSFLDRIVHKVAFINPSVQLIAQDVERFYFYEKYKDIKVSNPVFITSLPRAGTTLLLECFNLLHGFSASLYRDMPFIAAPMLWNALSSRFKKDMELKERAHGDGMRVGYDSSEAFEEIIWKLNWPEKYSEERIQLWTAQDDLREFRQNFIEYMQKLNFVRLGKNAADGRYVSKNNANIARIEYLKKIIPRCEIIVPFRNPVDHSISLMTQHNNFLKQHEKEPFTKTYMADIGHYEFGVLHKPLNFQGVDTLIQQYSPDSLEYWIAYWIISFKSVLSFKDKVILLSYERACKNGAVTMHTLSERLDIPIDSDVDEAATLYRASKSYGMDNEIKQKHKELLKEAYELHESLLSYSII